MTIKIIILQDIGIYSLSPGIEVIYLFTVERGTNQDEYGAFCFDVLYRGMWRLGKHKTVLYF